MKMAVFWENIKYLYRKEDPGTKLLRQAIDKRQDYINDLAIFLRNKYGEEFEKYMNRRGEVRRQKQAEQQRLQGIEQQAAGIPQETQQQPPQTVKSLTTEEKRKQALRAREERLTNLFMSTLKRQIKQY
jgi:recombinational DNA repair ATPase RecF